MTSGAAKSLTRSAKLYEIKREARELEPEARLLQRRQRSKPIADALLTAQRQTLVDSVKQDGRSGFTAIVGEGMRHGGLDTGRP
jgi:hypothetical protein